MLTRRRFLAGLGWGVLAGPVAAALPTGGAQRELPIVRRWHTGNRRLSPITESGGRVLYAGDRRLGLLDPAGGQPVWSVEHRLPQGSVFRPRTADGLVVCSGLREISVWQLDSGELRWRLPARRQFGVPLLADGRLYLGDGHDLLALDLSSGSPIWRFSAIADTQISYAPVVAAGRLLVGPGDGRLYALDAASGRLLWKLDRFDDWQYLRQLHVSGDILVAGSYLEKLFGIDIESGRQRWEFNAGNFINSHHVADGLVYLWSPTGWLYAIDTGNGSVRWRYRTTDYGDSRYNWGPMMAELVTHEGMLFALDMHNVLHLLSAAEGHEHNRFQLPESVRPFVLPLQERGLMFGSTQGDLLLAEMAG